MLIKGKVFVHNFLQNNRICCQFNLEFPIVQAGMIWTSGHELATACAQSGIMGVLGAGSMTLEVLEEHLQKAQKNLTSNEWSRLAVNLPLFYHRILEQIDLCLKYKVKNFITSAGNPQKFTSHLQEQGCKVLHVVSNSSQAHKAQNAGVDALIAEGFEAGGHNGKEELTTLALLTLLKKQITIPLIAAGGIHDASTSLAAIVLGAEGVQMGTRFLMTQESSAHQNFKNLLLNSSGDVTELVLKKLTPVRLYKNAFYDQVKEAEDAGASREEMLSLLGKGRPRQGIFEGNLDAGELEIGQVCSAIEDIPRAQDLIQKIIQDFEKIIQEIKNEW